MIDEIEDPSDPPAIVLKYLDEDLLHASAAKRLTRPEVKHVAKRVLEALEALHGEGYVHSGMGVVYAALQMKMITLFQMLSWTMYWSTTDSRTPTLGSPTLNWLTWEVPYTLIPDRRWAEVLSARLYFGALKLSCN